MKVYILIFCIVLTSSITYSQSNGYCGTSNLLNSSEGQLFYQELNELVQDQLADGISGDRSTLVVPLVFHIVYNSNNENIHDSLIYQQIQILNDDFKRMNADTVNTPVAFQSVAGAMDIEFCLATLDPDGNPTDGILRIQTSETSFSSVTSYSVPDPVKHNSSGGSDAWPTNVYMNIWICNLTGSTAYTAPPGNFVDPADDGIVCHYNHIGNSGVTPYGQGRTIVHEMAHWFGLKHIWGDDGGNCTGTDYIADTPNQGDWTGGCPNFPLTDACSQTAPGIMFMNYMDYAEDGCRNMFSQGQVDYMVAVYDAIMTGYYTEDKCVDYTSVEENLDSNFKWHFSENQLSIQSNQRMNLVEVYNLQGQLVKQIQPNKSLEVGMSFSEKGHYIVRVFFEDHKFSKQLIQIP